MLLSHYQALEEANSSRVISAPGMTFPLLFAHTSAFDSTFDYHLLLEALSGVLDWTLFHGALLFFFYSTIASVFLNP